MGMSVLSRGDVIKPHTHTTHTQHTHWKPTHTRASGGAEECQCQWRCSAGPNRHERSVEEVVTLEPHTHTHARTRTSPQTPFMRLMDKHAPRTAPPPPISSQGTALAAPFRLLRVDRHSYPLNWTKAHPSPCRSFTSPSAVAVHAALTTLLHLSVGLTQPPCPRLPASAPRRGAPRGATTSSARGCRATVMNVAPATIMSCSCNDNIQNKSQAIVHE